MTTTTSRPDPAVAARPAGTRHTGAAGRAGPAGTAGRAGPGTAKQAAKQAVEANSTRLAFSLGATDVQLTLPPLDKLAFYAGLAGAVAFGVLEWPIAVVTGVGHLLSDDRRNRTLHALGEALDAV